MCAHAQGRSLLWGWLQEKPRKVGEYDYAGCLSLPRLLYLEVGAGLVEGRLMCAMERVMCMRVSCFAVLEIWADNEHAWAA